MKTLVFLDGRVLQNHRSIIQKSRYPVALRKYRFSTRGSTTENGGFTLRSPSFHNIGFHSEFLWTNFMDITQIKKTMSYKIKSLIYLICFIASAILYYTTSLEEELPEQNGSVELVKADMEDYTNQDLYLGNTE